MTFGARGRSVGAAWAPHSLGESRQRGGDRQAMGSLHAHLVATHAPGCREVVRPNENGILVPVGDARALADALERLAREPATRAQMSERSREIACNDFGEDRVLAATLAIYRSKTEE